MRRYLLLFLAAGALAAAAGLALPALAGSGAGANGQQPAAAAPLDLGAIPVKPVTAHPSVQRAGDDDEWGEGPRAGKAEHTGLRGIAEAGDNSAREEPGERD